MGADLVIRGGTVIDGTGGPRRQADVAVTDGRISAIGGGLSGAKELDASGCIVAPGFIDIHTHYDAQVFWDPALSPSCFHGITTVIAGNCGFSIAPTRPEHRGLIAATLKEVEDMDIDTLAAGIPWEFESFPDYLASVERRGSVLNFGAYVGHTALRLYVMGDDASERAATPTEVGRMKEIVHEALMAGAAGFASSYAMTHRGADGRPVPSRLAADEENEALFKVVGDARRGVVAITAGQNLMVERMYEVQKRSGAPFTYTALLTNPSGTHLRLLEVNRQGWEAGAQVWPQVTCRPLAFSMLVSEPFTLNPNREFAALMGAPLSQRRDAYGDPAWRDRVRDAWASQAAMKPRWDTYSIMESQAHPELVGEHLCAIAAQRGVEPFEALLDLALDEPNLALRVRAILANDDADGIQKLLSDDRCTLGLSDAGAHVGQLCDAPMATDLLGNWVRDRAVMTLEKAVRKLSGQQADIYNLAGRGYLRDGAFADVTVFDPDTVAPGPVRRVRDFPANGERLTADEPQGIRHVLVNGTPIHADGAPVAEARESRPGHIARPAPRV